MNVVGFDLDGTLFDSEGIDYEDPKSVVEKTKPHATACKKTAALIAVGVPVHFISGRGKHLAAVTLAQLQSWVDARIKAEHLHLQDKFTGYEAMVNFKAGKLVEIGAYGYCGDHPKDKEAADLAGVRFLHADAWRQP